MAQGLLLVMAGDLLGLDRLLVPQPLAAEGLVIGVEDRGPPPAEGGAHPIALPVLRGEVAHHDQRVALLVPTEEGHGIGLIVVGAQPLEPLPGVILLPQGGLGEVEVVGRLEEGLGLAVGLVLEQVPVQGVLVVPLVPLGPAPPP